MQLQAFLINTVGKEYKSTEEGFGRKP